MKRISCAHNTNYKNYPFIPGSLDYNNPLDNHPFKVKTTFKDSKNFRVDGIPTWVFGGSSVFVHSHKDKRFTGMFYMVERNKEEGWAIIRNMKDEEWFGTEGEIIDEEAIIDNPPNWHPIRRTWLCNWYYYNEENAIGGI